MIEDEKLGVKIAENPREEMIEELRESSKKRILQLELTLELEKNAAKFLETLK
jgi:hypothetical protein